MRRNALRLALVEVRLLTREPMVIVGLIGFPLVTVLILAGVFGQSPDPEFAGVVPSEHYLVGYIGVVLAALGLVTIPVHLSTHRELGVLRRFRASGIGGGVMVCAEITLGVVLGTVAAAVVLTVGVAVYGLSMPVHPLTVVVWYVTGLACFIAIGVALGTL
ncbi:MAG TPA: ABC transporter permease, partial [Acidimicrobiia bacterium]|nr:ABC transporter permease [Acidimicrobiia bacterium]